MSQPSFVRLLADAVQPMMRRPEGLQVAALCTRQGAGGGAEVLLVTSRGTGRWILPKGWPMAGRTLAQAAGQEAWEEAGVRGTVDPEPMGSYAAAKVTDGGLEMPCRISVFRLRVSEMSDSFPEAGQRSRRWMFPAEAAAAVREPELSAILAAL